MLAELAEGLLEPGVAPPRALEVSEREMAGRMRGCEGLKVQPLGLELADDPCPHDVAAPERAVRGREQSELDELPQAIGADSGSPGHLFRAETVGIDRARVASVSSRIGNEDGAAGLRAEVVDLPVVLRRGGSVIRLDSHPADRIDHHRHGRSR